ncbi:MAG: hypothetical protein AAFP00_11965, partial [Bacteroidota bacterium]
MHKTVAFWAPDRCDVCRNWLQEAKKEKADGKDKGPIWRGLKVWVMGFEKSKRVKGLAVIPEEHRDFLFPAPSPLPEDPVPSNSGILQIGGFNLFPDMESEDTGLSRAQEDLILAGQDPSGVPVPEVPPKSPSIHSSSVAPSQPPSPDPSSSEDDDDDMTGIEPGQPGPEVPMQPPTKPLPEPQAPENPYEAWMTLQMNQSKTMMDMIAQMQEQFKVIHEDIRELKGMDDDTPVPSPAPSENMDIDPPVKQASQDLKDDPLNPWRPCFATQLSADKSTLQGVQPDGVAWSLPTSRIRFEDFSKFPNTRWRMDLSASTDRQVAQKEKILIELEAA